MDHNTTTAWNNRLEHNTTTDEERALRVVRMGDMIAQAPEGEVRTVLSRVKMEKSLTANMKALEGNDTSSDMLSLTIAYLLSTVVTDERILMMLKKGKVMLLMRTIMNLMPTQCTTCTKDYHYLVGEKVEVRCTRCHLPACGECHPKRVPHWHFLCGRCTGKVEEQALFVEEAYSRKKKKVETVVVAQPSQPTPQPSTQATSDIVELEETIEPEELEVLEDRRNKMVNEAGGKEKMEKKKREEEEEERRRKEKRICRAFQYGGTCPHGMSGKKEHGGRKECGWEHPKVCNRLLAHGDRGSQGCDGSTCPKFHPKMCHTSTTSRRCHRERCTFWHTKGTTFTGPRLVEMRVGREEQPRRSNEANWRIRREEVPRREQVMRREEVPWRRKGVPRRREELPRRSEERPRRREEGSRREEDRRPKQDFPELNNLIRREIQRALHSLGEEEAMGRRSWRREEARSYPEGSWRNHH